MGDSMQPHDFANYKKIFIGKNPSLDTIFCLAILRATVSGFKNIPVLYTTKEKTTFADDELMIGGSALPLHEYSFDGKQVGLLMNCLTLLQLTTDMKYDQLLRYKKAPRLNSPFDFVQMMRHGFNYKTMEDALLFLDFMWNAYLAHQENFVAQDCNQARLYEYVSGRYDREIATVVSADHETAGALRHSGKTFVVIYNPDSHTVIVQGRRHSKGKQLTVGVVESLTNLLQFFQEEGSSQFSLYQWNFNSEKPQVRGDLKTNVQVNDVEEFLASIARKLQVIDTEVLSELAHLASEDRPRLSRSSHKKTRGFELDESSHDNSKNSPSLGIELHGLLSSLKNLKTTEKNVEVSMVLPEPDADFAAMLAQAQAAINGA